MKVLLSVIVAALLLLAAVVPCTLAKTNSDSTESSVVLTKDTFEELTKGKTVFIKFFIPSCGHCQELAPAWNKMAAEWKSHPVGLVGAVDCSVEEEFCEKDFNIQGLPTLLYGDASEMGAYLQEYRDNKSYHALSAFANKTLTKPVCSPANLEACEPDMRKQIESILKLSKKKLSAQIDKLEQDIVNADKKFAQEFKKMQTKYDKVAANYQAKVAQIKTNIQMIKSIQQMKDE